MKKRNIFIGIALLIFTVLACSLVTPQATPLSPAPQPQINAIPQSEDDVPRISVSEAKAALDSGAAVIVDVRSAEAFASTRVAGAVSIPLQNFEGNGVRNLSLEKDQWIITYCT
jgi:3-mercaptopyruvate sulfurtransferase SseA